MIKEPNKYTEHADRVTKKTKDLANKTEELTIKGITFVEDLLEDFLNPIVKKREDTKK